VTEPIEFTFIFLAPALYALHALLTGLAFIIMNALQVRLGFGFSAGLIDYLLNFRLATRPLWLLPVGAAYFALYYLVFRFVIVRFDLKTPGREVLAAAPDPQPRAEPLGQGAAWLAALGGAANLLSVDACTTRLRLGVASQSVVSEAALRRLGARGLVRPSAQALQVVVGPTADALAEEIRHASQRHGAKAQPANAEAHDRTSLIDEQGFLAGDELLAALGGRSNVRAVELAAGRVRIAVTDVALVQREAILALGLRGVALPKRDTLHILTAPGQAASVAAALARTIG